jgi:hypothetical protein
MPDNVPDPSSAQPERPRVAMNMPPGFAEMCAARGVEPAFLARRLTELFIEVDREAEELFPDWESTPPHERLQFCLGAVTARADLEFPPNCGSG